MEMEVKDNTILLDGKVVNNLDNLVIDFIKILEKYTDYLIKIKSKNMLSN